MHTSGNTQPMDIKEFIILHLNDNTDRLLLSAKKYPEINIPRAVEQISARRQIKEKLPSWYANPALVFPSRISTEQCSSELTARYKQQLLLGSRLCDLTGGLGIDAFYFSQKAEQVYYIERFPEYCEAAAANFKALGAGNIKVINEDSQKLAGTLEADTFYIDPARRDGGNKRVFALCDCEPDVLQLKPLLLEHARRLIIKISPMADIAETLRLLPETKEIHILSVKNECKELLFVLGNNYSRQEPLIHCVNYNTPDSPLIFTFRQSEEKEAPLQTTPTVSEYLYEPNSSILKAGAFKLTATRLGLQKLHQHSHLYTSAQSVGNFPGRSFIVREVFEFSGKLLRHLKESLPQANLTVRNFNLTVAELRKRSGISEGGDIYLFATTVGSRQVLIKCEKQQ